MPFGIKGFSEIRKVFIGGLNFFPAQGFPIDRVIFPQCDFTELVREFHPLCLDLIKRKGSDYVPIFHGYLWAIPIMTTQPIVHRRSGNLRRSADSLDYIKTLLPTHLTQPGSKKRKNQISHIGVFRMSVHKLNDCLSPFQRRKIGPA